MGQLLEAFIPKSVHQDAQTGARKLPSRSHACSFAKNAVPHACVYLLEHMETNSFAHVTTIGRPREGGQNALDLIHLLISCYKLFTSISQCFSRMNPR
nr:hypothetical protein [Tanacetum cinerariifolium]